jgi:MerR HTH family regulatory protein
MAVMAFEGLWTLDELVRRAAVALAGPAYPGSPNGRVRDVPDRRTVRWYSTIGLVDRPAAMQGRTALYGVRHLLQIVAVKRFQAQGRSLAEIQAELAGATDDMLRRVAEVSDDLVEGAASPPPAPVARKRFWAERPAATAPAPDAATDTVTVRAAVSLPGGATLLLPGHPGPEDLSAIHAAVGPLIDLLAERGLLECEEWSPS